jgi:hypothetical protein
VRIIEGVTAPAHTATKLECERIKSWQWAETALPFIEDCTRVTRKTVVVYIDRHQPEAIDGPL